MNNKLDVYLDNYAQKSMNNYILDCYDKYE